MTTVPGIDMAQVKAALARVAQAEGTAEDAELLGDAMQVLILRLFAVEREIENAAIVKALG